MFTVYANFIIILNEYIEKETTPHKFWTFYSSKALARELLHQKNKVTEARRAQFSIGNILA